jgi:CheY-like chemotaxis protein
MTSSSESLLTVAIVDDDPAILAALSRALKMENYKVELHGDGTSALRAFQTSAPDAIVLDLQLPDVDGLEICRRLRRAGDNVPILMLTARDAVNDRVEGRGACRHPDGVIRFVRTALSVFAEDFNQHAAGHPCQFAQSARVSYIPHQSDVKDLEWE